MNTPKPQDTAALLRAVADQLEKPANVNTQEAWALLARRELERVEKARSAVVFHPLPPTPSEDGWMAVWPLEDLDNKPTRK